MADLQLGRQLSDCSGDLAGVQAVIVHLDLHPVQAACQLTQRALRWQCLPEGPQQPDPLSCYIRFLVLHMHDDRCMAVINSLSNVSSMQYALHIFHEVRLAEHAGYCLGLRSCVDRMLDFHLQSLGMKGTLCAMQYDKVRTMPSGMKLPSSAWATCQFGGMSECAGVSL